MKSDAAYLSLLHPYNVKDGPSPYTKFLLSIYPSLSKAACSYIDKHSYTITLKKNKRLLKSGQFCTYLFFVTSGVLRAYILQGKKEITTWIIEENNLGTSIESFYRQAKATENISAVENCQLAAIDYDSLQYLYTHFPEMNLVSRLILEQYYIEADQRAYISRLTNASDKYVHFLKTRGSLLNRIPLKFIASYLNMTLETLSRLRSKLHKNIQ